jgi:D-alanine-D-alanine ligase
MLDEDGRPYVGSGAAASRAAMDKVLTKTVAGSLGIRTAPTAILDPSDTGLALELPVVVKPIFEGSTIGLHVCRTREQWLEAHRATVASGKPAMIEPMIAGRELTVGLVDRGRGLTALPVIRITPAEGLYDYEAKYTRDDTRYEIDPALPPGVGERVQRQTMELARAIGVRDLCRADFILDERGEAYLLEINTMPGFTDHSLVPMAAAAAGIDLPTLCARFVDNAMERSSHGRKEAERASRGRV